MIILLPSYAARHCRPKRGKYRPRLKERARWDFAYRLERVKRSGSQFPSELSNVFQLLMAMTDFCVGRFVGRFIARQAWQKFS